MPMLQRLAAGGGRSRLGTNLVLLPLHNPVEIAEIAAFLDIATGGRFTLGMGSAIVARSSPSSVCGWPSG
jgi:alkanesulfonate monooxygenase SsuD/methylene tetrahydromethanopterin reductase-like flavin-dependent oxidoreductase (luciferase family)